MPTRQQIAEREQKARMKVRNARRKKRRQYEPVFCKDCKQQIFQPVALVIEVPLGWTDLTKDALRSGQVKILGAQWEGADWTCHCSVTAPESRCKL